MLRTVREEKYILHTTKRKKANWIGHILHKNSILKQVIEERIEGKDRSEGNTRKKT